MRRKKTSKKGAQETWLITYIDFLTLMVVFFVIFFALSIPKDFNFKVILSQFTGFANLNGGQTLADKGRLPQLGSNVNTLPSKTQGEHLWQGQKQLKLIFQNSIRSHQVKVSVNERGFKISLAGQVFFKKNTATLDMDQARSLLQKVALMLTSPELKNAKIRIEGHASQIADNKDTWDLAAMRALNVLKVLNAYGVSGNRMQEVSYGQTKPYVVNGKELNDSFNDRVDLVVLTDGKF